MTIASLIVDVAANTASLNKGMQEVQSSMDKVGSVAKTMAGMLGVAFSAQAVIGFGKALIADADALTKLSDKTGVSMQWLQKFQIAGDDAGNTVEQLTSAISQMENRLASGDRSAVSALGKLGLSLEDLNKLTPENQFIAISEAIRGIHDPAQQTMVAMDLFGKSGAEILPTLKRGFDDLKDSAVGMSDETIRAFDAAGDALDKWWRTAKGVTANAIVEFVRLGASGFSYTNATAHALAREVKELYEEIDRMTAKVPPAKKAMATMFDPIKSDSPEVQRWLKENEKKFDEHAAGVKRSSDKVKEWNKSVDDATIAMNLSTFALHRFGAVELPNVQSSLQGVDLTINELSSSTLPNLSINLNKVGQDAGNTMGLFRREANQSKDTLGELSQAFSMVGQIAGGSLGGIVRDVGSVVGSINLAKTAISQMESGVKGLDAVVAGLGIAGAFMSIGTTITGVLDRLLPGFEAWDRIINKVRDSIDEAFRRADEMGAYQDRWGRWQIPTPPAAPPSLPPAIPQADGGDWMVTKPTLFLAGEAGPERATFTPQGKGKSGGGMSMSTAALEAKVDRLSRAIERRLPAAIATAVKSAVVLAR